MTGLHDVPADVVALHIADRLTPLELWRASRASRSLMRCFASAGRLVALKRGTHAKRDPRDERAKLEVTVIRVVCAEARDGVVTQKETRVLPASSRIRIVTAALFEQVCRRNPLARPHPFTRLPHAGAALWHKSEGNAIHVEGVLYGGGDREKHRVGSGAMQCASDALDEIARPATPQQRSACVDDAAAVASLARAVVHGDNAEELAVVDAFVAAACALSHGGGRR